MKYIGAVLVFAACLGGGIYRAMLIKKRVRTLEGLAAALELMRGEICQRLLDMPTVFEKILPTVNRETRPFFEELSASSDKLGDLPLSEIWRGCAEKNLYILHEGELNALCALGETLGRYDALIQSNAIEGTLDVIKASLREASAQSAGGVKTAIGVGASLGLMLLITLI